MHAGGGAPVTVLPGQHTVDQRSDRALLTGAGTAIGALLITGLATGVAVGLLQWWLVLRGRLLRARLWPPVVAIAWPLGWTVTWAFGIDVERGFLVFGASGALVFAAVTGLAMLLMLRGRGGLARRSTGQRSTQPRRRGETL